jgi:SAM-dependent MidA family methyltransferase
LRVERWALRTPTGNAALIELIRNEIRNRGPQSFAWFMEQVLYHPEHGYYSSGRCAIGRKGDYFTNVSVGPLFGELMMAQFAEIWRQLGKINNFVIVEQGAHDGQFAHDVLESARARAPDFFENFCYRIIEPFPILRERQSQTLESFRDKVEWCKSLEPFTGIHFSNELLDAMPVRLISGDTEKLVNLQDDKFVFVERPLSSEAFNQAALDWIDSVATNLQRGYVIAVDYGHSCNEFQREIQIRTQHRYLDSPFEQTGYADITMHVDWTSIASRAQAIGLRLAGFTDQHHFLTGIISAWPDLLPARWSNLTRERPRSDVPITDIDDKTKRALQTLLHPEMLGRSFQVLALEKSVHPLRPLAGFQFARDPSFA